MGLRLRRELARRLRSVRHAVRREGHSAAAKAGRLTAACVAAYLVAHAALPHADPVLAPLTALLVVQLTLRSTLTSGLQRVVSVVAGVAVAEFLSSVVGLHWWSLGLLISLTVVLGQLLRLGDHLLEVPISAMLVLAVGGRESFAAQRIAETVLGAAVGVGLNLLVPPALRRADAGAGVEHAANEVADLLQRAADGMAAGASVDAAEQWLLEARGLGRAIGEADRALREAGDRRRLNPRAAFTADTLPLLRSGLESLELASVSLRALLRSVAEGLREEASGATPDDVRQAFAVLLDDLAQTVRTFGALLRAEELAGATWATTGEAELTARAQPPADQLGAALEALRETRVRLTELLLTDAEAHPGLWQLRGSLLASVDQMLQALDVERRVRTREQWREGARARVAPPRVPVRRRV